MLRNEMQSFTREIETHMGLWFNWVFFSILATGDLDINNGKKKVDIKFNRHNRYAQNQ